MSITLIALAAHGYDGHQHIARITGLDPQSNFRMESIMQQLVGPYNPHRATVYVDTPGLYVTCDVIRTGKKEVRYHIITDFGDELWKFRTGADNLDGLGGRDAAMQIAKRLDLGESIQQVVEVHTDQFGVPKYRIRNCSVVTVDAATQQCWAILQDLPELEANKVLTALKAKVSARFKRAGAGEAQSAAGDTEVTAAHESVSD